MKTQTGPPDRTPSIPADLIEAFPILREGRLITLAEWAAIRRVKAASISRQMRRGAADMPRVTRIGSRPYFAPQDVAAFLLERRTAGAA